MVPETGQAGQGTGQTGQETGQTGQGTGQTGQAREVVCLSVADRSRHALTVQLSYTQTVCQLDTEG